MSLFRTCPCCSKRVSRGHTLCSQHEKDYGNKFRDFPIWLKKIYYFDRTVLKEEKEYAKLFVIEPLESFENISCDSEKVEYVDGHQTN